MVRTHKVLRRSIFFCSVRLEGFANKYEIKLLSTMFIWLASLCSAKIIIQCYYDIHNHHVRLICS